MSVTKRKWKTPTGEPKEAWAVRYNDGSGTWRLRTYQRKKDADAFHDTVKVAVRTGTHTPDSASVTMAEAGRRWIKNGEANSLERTTLRDYQCHLDRHIIPLLGTVKLSKLTAPMVSKFRDDLRDGTPPRSPAMVRKILTSLSSILADAHEAGLVAQNVARSVGRRKKKTKAEQKRKLQAGVDIPTVAEIRAIIGKLEGRWRPLLLTAIFTGLRASELRGLRWSDIDFAKAEISVRQRADRYNKLDAPKSEAGERTVPLPPDLVKVLREWKLACPKGTLGLAFPTGTGGVENLANMFYRGLRRTQLAAGVVDVDRVAKYGFHSLRHFFASWCINREADGGLELPGKVVQERMGHSSITMTMDRYGHLFPRGDDGGKLAKAALRLLG
jgi:integrase